ncbi:MAG: aminotransferase class V-fold PLP-dependent enzyme [Chloroherpetonaceae bacterium]|nr:aminotransferase class V-fold PLP-dependent enzyme [Chloroherpetonaceae bacterium]
MPSRRKFLHDTLLAGTGLALLQQEALAKLAKAVAALPTNRSPEQVATDEDFWTTVQQAFAVDRSLINLNNGGVSPAPRVVMDALKQYLDYSNLAPAYTMWRHLEPRIETVREGLAEMFGCSPEEVAITRNASESLQTLQFGLELRRGDEVITTVQDYPRMITTWQQRVRRDGIVLKKVRYPVPLINPKDFVRAIEEAITPKTRVIHVSHIVVYTGQILPVAEICQIGKARGIEVIVDGAHSFAHLPFKQADLGCDYFGASLHKWLYAPIGTGLLYVRKEKIKNVWSLFAAPESMQNDIRKFEEIGTHPAANHNAIAEALGFNENLGIARKAARLRYLQRLWIERLRKFENVRFRINIDDESQWCGLVNVHIEGTDPSKVQSYLFEKHRIYTVAILPLPDSPPIKTPFSDDFTGIRITPNVYTRPSEIERFADAMEKIAKGVVKEVKA